MKIAYITDERGQQVAYPMFESGAPTKSPLVQLVEAFEQLQRVQKYLYASTYASDGMGSMSWAHWYDDVASAVEILRDREQSLRHAIAMRIGAKTIE